MTSKISLKKLLKGKKVLRENNKIIHLGLSFDDVDGSFIQIILESMPMELEQLRSLSLSHAHFDEIPDLFKYLENLEKLDMNSCGLTNIDNISYLKNLKELYLSGNPINRIPSSIDQLKELEILKISFYHLEEDNSIIPDSFANLHKLKKLILCPSKTCQTELPQTIANLENLEMLELGYSSFKLPKSMGNLKSLKELKVLDTEETTEFSELPADIGKCQSLEKIVVHETNLSQLPESITELRTLVHLDLSYNRLRKLPEKIDQWSKLEYLDLNWNELDSIPDTIGKITSLKTFYLIETDPEYMDKLVKNLPRSILKLKNLADSDLFWLGEDKRVPWIQEFIKNKTKK